MVTIFEEEQRKTAMIRAVRALPTLLPASGDFMVVQELGPSHFDKQGGWGFRLDLRVGGKSWAGVTYSVGDAHKVPPAMSDVIACLLSDAASADQPFEDWAAEYGFDVDSRKAEATHKACGGIRHGLMRLLGHEYQAAVSSDHEEWSKTRFGSARTFRASRSVGAQS